MKHTTSHQYDMKLREANPKIQREKTGIAILCPFCDPPHLLVPDKVSPCGTMIVVKAVQTIMPEKRAKRDKIACMKCHQIGWGNMVKFMDGFVHMHDCSPGTIMMVETPPFSALAKFAHGLGAKNPIRKAIEKRNGLAQAVNEIDSTGKKTGKVLGYVFYQEQVKHGETPSAGARE